MCVHSRKRDPQMLMMSKSSCIWSEMELFILKFCSRFSRAHRSLAFGKEVGQDEQLPKDGLD